MPPQQITLPLVGDLFPVFSFRSSRFAPDGNTVVSAAPLEVVASVYGGGGLYESGGVSEAFGGVALWRNEDTNNRYLGVWGARNASRFRMDLRRAGIDIEVINRPPPARLVYWATGGPRPKRISYSTAMPAAKFQLPPATPATLADEEIAFIKQTIQRFYGDTATIRNFGPDPNLLQLHVEADRDVTLQRWNCLGILMTRIERRIDLVVTRRGTKIFGAAKLAYRQGVLL